MDYLNVKIVEMNMMEVMVQEDFVPIIVDESFVVKELI
jgi:hypothetical protein